jgi:hypothetical protein
VLDEALGRGTLAQAVAVGGALVAAAAAYLGAARLLGMREVAVLTRRGTTDS